MLRTQVISVVAFVSIVTCISFAQGNTHFEASTSTPTLPFYFEPNLGQAHEGIKYVSRNGASSVAVSGQGLAIRLARPVPSSVNGVPPVRQDEVNLVFAGSTPSPVVSGEQPQPGRSNYFVGNVPNKWLRNVPHYDKVRIRSIYPGIDALFYAKADRKVEFDLVVGPGSDPNQIRLAFKGAQSLSLDNMGQLLVHSSGGTLVENKPKAYELVNGQKRFVDAHYVLYPNNEAHLYVGDHDPHNTLDRTCLVLFKNDWRKTIVRGTVPTSARQTRLSAQDPSFRKEAAPVPTHYSRLLIHIT